MSSTSIPCGVLEPHMEDVLELKFRNDIGSCVADADVTQVDDVVFVGEDEHRQSCFRCQWQVTCVEELKECREDALTLGLLVQLHFLSVNTARHICDGNVLNAYCTENS